MTLINSFIGGTNQINISYGMTPGLGIDTITTEISPDLVAAMATSIKYLSETMARLPVAARDENGYVLDIPENTLFIKPNTYQTWFEFARTAEVKVNRYGNALALIKRKGGRAVSLDLIHENRIKGYELKGGTLYYLIEVESGKQQRIIAEDILHFKNYTINGLWGMNPVELLKYNYEMIGKTQHAVSGHLSNGLLGISTLEAGVEGIGAFGKELQAAMKKFEETKGYLGTDKVVPLPPGFKLNNVPINLKDADFLANIKANSQFIAALYGVPPHIVTGDSPKYANFEQSMIEFRQGTVAAKTAQYKAELELKLFPDELVLNRQIEIVYDISKLVATDARTQTLIDESLFKMGVKNGGQIARERGLPADYEGADKRFIMTNNLGDITASGEEETNDQGQQDTGI